MCLQCICCYVFATCLLCVWFVLGLQRKLRVGEEVKCTVLNLMRYGALVEVSNGRGNASPSLRAVLSLPPSLSVASFLLCPLSGDRGVRGVRERGLSIVAPSLPGPPAPSLCPVRVRMWRPKSCLVGTVPLSYTAYSAYPVARAPGAGSYLFWFPAPRNNGVHQLQ